MKSSALLALLCVSTACCLPRRILPRAIQTLVATVDPPPFVVTLEFNSPDSTTSSLPLVGFTTSVQTSLQSTYSSTEISSSLPLEGYTSLSDVQTSLPSTQSSVFTASNTLDPAFTASTPSDPTFTPSITLDPTFTASITTTDVIPEVPIATISTSNGTAQILPTPTTSCPEATGSVITSLITTNIQTDAPIISTTIEVPSTTISVSSVSSILTSIPDPGLPSANIFQPISTGRPHSFIPTRADHPVPRLGINQNGPIQTNKFYANFFLDTQENSTWTNPYSVQWAKGRGESWGMVITHVDVEDRVFGPTAATEPPTYFTHPLGVQALVLSEAGLGRETVLTMDHLTEFAAHVNLSPRQGGAIAVTFPVVQGMGFTTGIYNGGTPVIQSGVLFRSVTRLDGSPKPGITKYRIVLEDSKVWFLYASSTDATGLDLKVINHGLIQATSNFNGFIQIAKSSGNAEAIYDATCGAYASDVVLSGTVDGGQGSYTFTYQKSGLSSSPLLMFALPHHVQSLSSQTKAGLTDLTLTTTTKGIATAIMADSWTLVEALPISLKFAPWSPEHGSVENLSPAAIAAMRDIAANEVSQDMSAQSNLDSMYFSGKALAKFAGIVYTLHNLMDEKALGQAGLQKLKDAFNRFVENRQQFPLVYEQVWGGVVSTQAYQTGDRLADFGNTYYNDHHFHFGYFIYTAAIIAHLDPSFLDTPAKSFVETLLRDISNPSPLDTYFPTSRGFSFYHGHSFAKGLFASPDGKDQESSSEDMMFAYSVKLWGLASGNANIEALGNLQLAITARSVKSYFLYESDNNIQPAKFIPNKVSGILFENTVAHTTYFGNNIEYIQGIHMLPLLPCSTLSRSKRFVNEEWSTYFSGDRANVAAGWRGVLYANLAIDDAQRSWDFFTQSGFEEGWLDGGASRTWYLALAAGLGGGPKDTAKRYAAAPAARNGMVMRGIMSAKGRPSIR